MTAKSFAGTSTVYTLLDAAPNSQYCHIFRQKGEAGGRLASLNAGDPGLYVGGGTINLSFGKALNTDIGGAFDTIHADALKAAKGGQAVTTSFVKGAPVRFVSAVAPAVIAPATAWPAEAAFLDVFADGFQPNGEPANAAMLYVVPPNGKNTSHYATAADFLAAVTRTAASAMGLLTDFNASQVPAHGGLGFAPIPVLRTCLLSGGQFRPPAVARDKVARAIFAGFAQALAAAGSAGGVTLVEFESADSEFAAIA